MGGATRFLLVLTTPRPPLLRFRLPRCPPSYSSLASVSLPPPSPPPRPRRRGVFLHIVKSSSSSQEFHSQVSTNSAGFEPPPSSPWPEWSSLLERLSNTGYFNRPPLEDDQFVAIHALSQEFRDSAEACLAFARDRPHLLRSLSRRDIDVVVRNGSAFLFKDSPDSVRKMHSFLEGHQSIAQDSDKACTVDLMKFLLSYASDPRASLDRAITNNKQLLESSVRSLFGQISNTIYSALQSDLSGSVIKQFPDKFGQPSWSSANNIEMKRGDWVCPGCCFMNFARNVKCLECEEVRPKRQLTGGEWECPQCDFFNYGKNLVCLRCDCKRPGEVSFSISNYQPGVRNGDYTNKVDIDNRLAANEEKAGRWFSKISQLDGTTDNSNIADEDFPEIMPLRKGVNRFVVSTRKTPLERRMANNKYQGDFGNDGTSEDDILQTTTSRSLDDILGRAAVVGTENKSSIAETSDHASKQYGYPRGRSSSYVPFVPLPADAFAKKPQSSQTEEKENLVTDNHKKSVASEASDPVAPSSRSKQSSMSEESLLLPQKPIQLDNKDKEKEQAEKSERWFKRVAELHDVTDLASAISDEDFPEIMPMRKGENRFVVSKKKDRSLTSPMYKRKMAMEQSSNTNFVPFVPFPADYFTKKDNRQSDGIAPSKATDVTSSPITSEKLPEKEGYTVPTENQRSTTENWNSTSSAGKIAETSETVTQGPNIDNVTNNIVGPQATRINSWTSGSFRKEEVTQCTNFSQQSENPNSNPNPNPNLNPRDSWTGKSLEGSAVKETDPLDMSEEAKAERWFRRAAQIKDISELSQIPDEDFPSIMPMRKGVNRFVVSKRKTPLERRLTSPQYRRNLPIITSEPPFKEDDTS